MKIPKQERRMNVTYDVFCVLKRLLVIKRNGEKLLEHTRVHVVYILRSMNVNHVNQIKLLLKRKKNVTKKIKHTHT